MIDSIILFWRLRKQSPWSQADPAFSLLNEKVDRTGLVCKINSRPTYLPTAIPYFLQPYHRKWLAWTDRWEQWGEPEWTQSHSTSDKKVPGTHMGAFRKLRDVSYSAGSKNPKTAVSSTECHTRVDCAVHSLWCGFTRFEGEKLRMPNCQEVVLFCADSQVHAIEIFYCTCLIDCHHSSQQGACYLFYFLVWKGYCEVMCHGPHMKFTWQLANSFFITWALGLNSGHQVWHQTFPAEPSHQPKEAVTHSTFCHSQWLMYVIPAFGKLSQEDCIKLFNFTKSQ